MVGLRRVTVNGVYRISPHARQVVEGWLLVQRVLQKDAREVGNIPLRRSAFEKRVDHALRYVGVAESIEGQDVVVEHHRRGGGDWYVVAIEMRWLGRSEMLRVTRDFYGRLSEVVAHT